MSDVENSDDERYANESFENESDNEIPEITEIESENSDNSDDEDEDALSSVKINTGPIKRNSYPSHLSTLHNTDTVPFASSSDEEDDVVVGQTLVEINTPSMHLHEQSVSEAESPAHNLKSILYEKLQANQGSSDEISDEDDEEEFRKIQDMEERYMQQNSAKLMKENLESKNSMEDNDKYLTDVEDSEEQEEETENETDLETGHENAVENSKVEPMENIESSKENISEEKKIQENKSKNPDKILEINSNTKLLIDQGNLIEIIQNSLANLTTSTNTSENDILMASQMLQPTTMMEESTMMLTSNSNSAAILNPQTIAMAVVNALKSTGLTNLQTASKNLEKEQREKKEQREETAKAIEIENKKENNDEFENNTNNDEETEVEADVQEIGDENYQGYELDYDDDRDVYYNSQFDYRITSKTPSSFNSDDYIFHANFIKTFHRTKSNDKLRAKPHQRKSMTFTNERMREIERHNQILLRKILTQKPTYTAKNKCAPAPIQKLPSQTNLRPSTSAVNRKKQQRQIDLDNQILKRKIEAISLRRRPLIS